MPAEGDTGSTMTADTVCGPVASMAASTAAAARSVRASPSSPAKGPRKLTGAVTLTVCMRCGSYARFTSQRPVIDRAPTVAPW